MIFHNPRVGKAMGLIILFAIGGVSGAAAALLLQRRGCRAYFPYVLVGILGALAGGFGAARLFGFAFRSSGRLEFEFLLLSCAGAIVGLVLATLGARLLQGTTGN